MRRRLTFGLAILGSAVAATLKTAPLLRHFATHVPADAQDPLLIAWILAWDVHVLATAPLRLFDANIFYPVERTLAFSDHLLGVVPIFAPPYLLTGNPVVGYNTLFVLSFALSALAGFSLAWHWTRDPWASLVGGALFGFAPYRFGQLSHLQMLNFFWAPWALVYLDRLLRTGRARDRAAFALFFCLQVLSELYLGFMLAVAVVVYLGCHAAGEGGRPRARALATAVGLAGAIGLVLLPFALPYLAVNRAWNASRTVGGIVAYSADLLSYLTAPPLVNDLYLAIFAPASPWPSSERGLFPGLVLVALTALGAAGRVRALPAADVRRLRRTFGLILLVAAVLSLGPFLVAFGVKTRVPLPYLLLYHVVPGWAGMRVPARFAFLAVLAATPIATLGAVRCAEVVAGRLGRRSHLAAPVVSAALVALLFVELGAKPLPLAEAPAAGAAHRWLAARRPGPIVELPLDLAEEYGHVFLSTAHWLPLVNGHSSFVPPTYLEAREALSRLPAPRAIEYAAALGVGAVVVHGDRLPPERRARWSAEAAARHGLDLLVSFGPDAIYRVPPVSTGTGLIAETAVPEWLPAGAPVRLGLLVRPDGSRPWAHPAPQGESAAIVTWKATGAGRILARTVRVQLPLAIPAGDTAAVPLRLTPPGDPGRYTLHVAIPSRGVVTAPVAVEIRAGTPVTSRDAPRRLGARYLLEEGPPSLVTTLADALPLAITAANTGTAVWLAKATNERGEVRLGWRWLRDGRETLPAPADARLRYDVFPGQHYRFRLLLDPPLAAGRYVLELALRSEGVATFERAGTPPLRLSVEVVGS